MDLVDDELMGANPFTEDVRVARSIAAVEYWNFIFLSDDAKGDDLFKLIE